MISWCNMIVFHSSELNGNAWMDDVDLMDRINRHSKQAGPVCDGCLRSCSVRSQPIREDITYVCLLSLAETMHDLRHSKRTLVTQPAVSLLATRAFVVEGGLKLTVSCILHELKTWNWLYSPNPPAWNWCEYFNVRYYVLWTFRLLTYMVKPICFVCCDLTGRPPNKWFAWNMVLW